MPEVSRPNNFKAPAGSSIDTVTAALTIGDYDSCTEPDYSTSSTGTERQRAFAAHQASQTGATVTQVALFERKSWQDLANCKGVDPDLFFPERGASTRESKGVCKGCTVRDDCLEYALDTGQKFGIWGGLSERERRRIRRQRALNKS